MRATTDSAPSAAAQAGGAPWSKLTLFAGRQLRARPELVLCPLSLAVILALWEAASRAELVSPIILPPPTRVWDGLVLLATAPWFPRQLWITAAETLLGFVLGSLAGIALGIMMVAVPLFSRVAMPYVIAFQVMPKVVLAPLFIAWFGFGIESKVALATAVAFFPVVLNTVVGLEAVEENALFLMRSLVASRRQVFLMLAWPTALPSIMAGLKVALTLALIGALVAEFITAKEGLGVLVATFSFELKTYLVFAVVIVISIFAMVLFALMEYADRKLVFWRRGNLSGE
jgi:NitT/TauT family transport system permease protein